jgi:hypothetical protein
MICICKSDKFNSAMTSIFGIVTVLGTFEADNRVEHNRMGRLNAMSKEGSNKVVNSLNLVLDEYLIMSALLLRRLLVACDRAIILERGMRGEFVYSSYSDEPFVEILFHKGLCLAEACGKGFVPTPLWEIYMYVIQSHVKEVTFWCDFWDLKLRTLLAYALCFPRLGASRELGGPKRREALSVSQGWRLLGLRIELKSWPLGKVRKIDTTSNQNSEGSPTLP